MAGEDWLVWCDELLIIPALVWCDELLIIPALVWCEELLIIPALVCCEELLIISALVWCEELLIIPALVWCEELLIIPALDELCIWCLLIVKKLFLYLCVGGSSVGMHYGRVVLLNFHLSDGNNVQITGSTFNLN
jgi:hypothetical protein